MPIRVTLKLATSLDGRIAMPSGESRWITGEASRTQGHRLRASHDAILVGVETVLADDPELTVRFGEEGSAVAQPLRIVLDSRLRTPPSAKVASGKTLILTATEPHPIGNAEVIWVASADGRPTIEAVFGALAERNITSVLIEGGGQVAASFIRAGRIDRLEWFRAPILLGAEGRPCIAGLALAKLGNAPKFRRLSAEPLGDDLWERYEAVR
ncbi:RibD family protein [Brevundimonas sp.]|uniref:RibD family protein n=1 Tax=Brevundimonas sp. TaxID=1871086 RepID=UPI00356275DD